MPGPKTRKKISVPADGSAQPKAARTGKGRKTTKASSPAPVTDVNTVDVKWDHDLTWSLIAAIQEDGDICHGLFPSPGANASTANGGGKKKTEFHFAIAEVIFTNHVEYGEDFARVGEATGKVKSALRKAWSGKIKNRLGNLVSNARKHMAAMRDTGAGLTREELEEYQTTDPELYNKWQAIQVDFPWYMDLRTLIGNRPNSNPVGLGNSKSDVDDAVLAGGPSASDTESIIAVDEGVDLDTTQVEEETTRARPISDVLDDDDELYMRSPTPSILQADKEVTSTVGKRKTPPEMSDSEEITATNASSRKNHMGAEGTSRKGAVSPAPTPNKVTTAGGTKGTSSKKSKAETKGAKKLKFSEDFVEIAVAEEQTKQKQLELRRMEREYELEKLKLKGAAKTDGLRMKFELEKAKLQAATDIRLAKLKYANRNSTSGDTGFNAPAAGFSGHGGGPSMYMGHVGGAFHQGEAMPQVRPVGHDGWETIGSDRALNRGASPALGTQQVGLDFTHFSGAGPSSRLWDDVPEPNDGK